MFVPEVFEMLQDSFRAAHKEYPFPNKGVEEAPVKFQAAIGEFTIRINEVIRKGLVDHMTDLETAYNEKMLRADAKVFVLSAIVGVSVVANGVMYFKFVL